MKISEFKPSNTSNEKTTYKVSEIGAAMQANPDYFEKALNPRVQNKAAMDSFYNNVLVPQLRQNNEANYLLKGYNSFIAEKENEQKKTSTFPLIDNAMMPDSFQGVVVKNYANSSKNAKNDVTQYKVTDDWNVTDKVNLAKLYSEDPEKAMEFAKIVNTAIKNEEYRKTGEEYPILSSIASVPVSVLSGVDYARNLVEYGTDKVMGRDTNLERSALSDLSGSLRQGVTDGTDWKIGNFDAFDFLYGVGMSTADMAAASMLGGGVNAITSKLATKLGASVGGKILGKALTSIGSGSVLGLSAASSTMNDVLDRGGTDAQALTSGLVAGAFETLFESLSIGEIKSMGRTSKEAFKELIKKSGKENVKILFKRLGVDALKSMGTNATEEAATELANVLYDTFANGDVSNYAIMVENYMKEDPTLTEEEAREKAIKQFTGQVLESAASGAIMGLFLGNGATVKAYMDANRQIQVNNAFDSVKKNIESNRLNNSINGVSGLQTESDADISEIGSNIKAQMNAGVRDSVSNIKNNLMQSAAKGSVTTPKIFNLSAANPKNDIVGDAIAKSSGVPNRSADQRTLQRLGRAFGTKIEFADLDYTTTDENGNEITISPEGQFDKDANTITLNTNAKDYHRPVEFIVKHELSHRTEIAGYDYEKFMGEVIHNSDVFNNYVQQRGFENVEAWIDDVIAKYQKSGKPLGNENESAETAAKKEIVADFVADVMFNGRNLDTMLNAMDPVHRNKFVKWISEIFQKLKDVFKGQNQYTEIERLEKQFLDVAKKAAKQKTTTEEGSGVKFSENIADVVDLSLDEELIGRIKNSDKSAITVMRDYIFEKLGGRDIKLSDGVTAMVDKSDAQHIANSARSGAEKAGISEIESIIKKAQYYNEVDATHDKFNRFRYYEVPVRYNDEISFVTLNVGKGKTDNKYHIYDLTKPKERNTPNRINGFGRPVGNALGKGVSNHSIPNSPESVNKKINEVTEEVNVEYDAQTESASPKSYSLASWERSDYVTNRDEAATELAKAIGVTEKKAQAYIDSINSVAKVIADDSARLDYNSAQGRSSFVSNAEYGGSIDFSTLCPKRKILTGTFTAIQKALKNTALTAEEILDIRNKMKEKGLEVSCGLCYVEGSRAQMGKFSKEFIERYKKTNPKYVPNMYDVNTPEGIERMRTEHPEVYAAYEKFWNNKGVLNEGDKVLFASQQKPKLYQTRTEYNGEILQKFESDGNVVEKNKMGGLRLQSFSDFEIVHLIDTMQVILDMSKVGLAGQAYTKVPDFALALGSTGLKINLSLIAKDVDANGNLIFDDVEGMPFDTAMRIRDMYSDNVGTILVAFNDAQLKAALADSRVDFIIPFHRSQWKKALYDKLGLPKGAKDYTYQQNEKYIKPVYYTTRNGTIGRRRATNYMPNEYWDFNKSGKENAENYLKMCAAENKRPKFYKLLVDNKDGSYSLQPDGSTDGYWKLLIDFKMYNNDGVGVPQQPVKPEFNMEESMRMLNEYQGGHQSFPVDQETVNEFVEEYRNKHKMDDFIEQNTETKSIANPYSISYSLPENPTALEIGDAYKNGEITSEEYVDRINGLWEETGKAEGTIKPGEIVEPPNKSVPTPKSVSDGTQVRQFMRTVLESGYATPEMEAYLKELILEGDYSYVPTSNKKSIAKAERNIENQGYQNAVSNWQRSLSKSTVDADTVATGEALLRMAFDQHNAVDIVNLTADLAELGTRMGQAVQAFSLLKRMGGISQLVYLQRSVNKINEDLKQRFKGSKKDAPVVKMNEKLAEKLAKAETEGEKEVVYGRIVKDIADQVPSTFLDKWNAWRYMAMLFNPTTHIRNVLGNGIFLPVVRMKDLIALGGEKIFVKAEDRTKVLKVKQEYQDFAEKDFLKIEPLLTGTGKYNPSDNIRDEMTVFKNKILEELRKFNFTALEKEDAIFLRKHYRHALGSFLQARNIDLKNMSNAQLLAAREYAFNEALKATYRDASKVANMLSQLSKTSKFANVLVEGVLPFKKTPINILKRGVEYSPIGIIKTLSKGIYDLKKGEFNAAQFIDGLAANAIGSIPFVIGMFLANLGIAKGGFDDEEEIDKLMGKQEYSIQIGDASYTIDWLAPASIPFFMGVAISEYEADEDGDFLSNLYDFGIKGFEPILNLSMLSGVNDMIDSVSYAEDAENLPQLIGSGISSYFSQALPTIFGKTANIFDDTKRTRYVDKTSNVPEIVQKALDKIASKTPFASKTRAEYINAWGETKYTGNFFQRFFQQFVSPGYASTVDQSAISEECLRLYRETGEKSVVPSTPAKYFTLKGNRRDLSKEEYYNFATFRGQMSADLVNEAINNAEYQKLTDEQKAEVITDIYDYVGALAKSQLSYSYEEIAAMEGGEDVLTPSRWNKLNDKAKQLLVNDYFLDGTKGKAYKQAQNGKSVADFYIKKVKSDSKK